MRNLQMILVCWFLSWHVSAEPLSQDVYLAIDKAHLILLDRLSPHQIHEDFNGDGKKDVAVFVEDKKTNKKGLRILHSGATSCIIIGAGINFYAAGDDLDWVNRWYLVPSGNVWETVIDSSGELRGRKRIGLQYGSIRLCMDEGGCGIVSFRSGKYFWVHQSD
jgi:hypothetical protein